MIGSVLTEEQRAALQAELDKLLASQATTFTTGQIVGVRDPDGRSATFAPVNETARQARIDYLQALLSACGGFRRRPLLVRF